MSFSSDEVRRIQRIYFDRDSGLPLPFPCLHPDVPGAREVENIYQELCVASGALERSWLALAFLHERLYGWERKHCKQPGI